ncbi:MAG: Ig-like domain-containing protein [Candidatus Krumholzibacteria bacterium]
MIARRVWAAAWLVVLAACAIPEPPPGGPEDTQPPKVSFTYPAEGESSVPADAEIQIGFDEGMNKSRFERMVNFQPPVVIRKARWKGNVLHLVLDEPLHPDTTYIVELKAGFSDAHGARSKEGARFAFATSAAVDSGVIAGRVLFRREPADKGVVRLFVLPKDSAFAVEAARPDRETACRKDGAFRLAYLPTDGTSFLVWAFQDNNGNLNYDPGKEAGAVATVSLGTDVWGVEDIEIDIVDPREPASVKGTVDNVTGVDSLPVVVTLHELADSMPPSYYVRCGSDGSFALDVLQGTYVLWSFLDFQNDSLCGTYPCAEDSARACAEPCVMYPDTLRVKPGDKVRLGKLVLGEEGAD